MCSPAESVRPVGLPSNASQNSRMRSDIRLGRSRPDKRISREKKSPGGLRICFRDERAGVSLPITPIFNE